MLSRILEGTLVLVLVFLVLRQASGFSRVVNGLGGTFTGAVQTVQRIGG